MSSWHLFCGLMQQTANSKTDRAGATSRGKKGSVPGFNEVSGRSEGSLPLLSPTQSLMVMPYLKPFKQITQPLCHQNGLWLPKMLWRRMDHLYPKGISSSLVPGLSINFLASSMPAARKQSPSREAPVNSLRSIQGPTRAGWGGRAASSMGKGCSGDAVL